MPVFGVAFLAFGLLVFLTQSTVTASWTVYDLAAGTALAPGAPTLQFGQVGEGTAHQVRQLSLSGQLAMAVGIVLLAGWIGFALGKRTGKPTPASAELLTSGAMRREIAAKTGNSAN
jgi:hypothetical protein